MSKIITGEGAYRPLVAEFNGFWHPPMVVEIDGLWHSPLLAEFVGVWDMPMASLPGRLRDLVEADSELRPHWDMLHPRERRLLVEQQDANLNPTRQEGIEDGFAREVRRQFVEDDRRVCDLSTATSWREKRKRRDDLSQLDAELAAIDREQAAAEQQSDPAGKLTMPAAKSEPQAVAQPALTPVKPVPRQQAQEMQLLETLVELDFDPGALPLPSRNGLVSPAKQAARKKLKHWTNDVFDKTWKRLRHGSEPRIKDAIR